ncbi:hypothetical protein BDN72DRAFT_906157 [Pluteus cervinus]|uniref:Uncharacterized protein n=1 Tax=Pluteus cervinus TaxID=181527 RepID=A0ACD3A0C1_9AGAR|nr:hypothetical protein BDN72DRAFT_906157 [Pluteus cervinus]
MTHRQLIYEGDSYDVELDKTVVGAGTHTNIVELENRMKNTHLMDSEQMNQATSSEMGSRPVFQPSKSRSARGSALYAVFRGRKTGIFPSWEATQQQVNGFSGQSFQGFRTLEEAFEAWADRARRGEIIDSVSGQALGPDVPPLLYNAEGLLCRSPGSPKNLIPPPTTRESCSPVPFAQSTALNEVEDVTSTSNQVWWVVLKGNHPGVYLGKNEASRAMGTQIGCTMTAVGGEVEANRLFVRESMAGNTEKGHKKGCTCYHDVDSIFNAVAEC